MTPSIHLPFLAGALPFAFALILGLSAVVVAFLLDSLNRARFFTGGFGSLVTVAVELEAALLPVEGPRAFLSWSSCSTSCSSSSSEREEDRARFLPLLLVEAEVDADWVRVRVL
jgi:hypothetical protein